jgi:lysozyme
VKARNTAITVATAASLATAVAYVKPWEGLWLTAKVDTIGTGRPVTACYGETENVKLGQKFTKQECDDLLEVKLKRYDAEIGRCIHVELPDYTRAALISFAYNVGSAGACRSTVVKRMNAGDIRGGCDALMQWTRAQGRVVKGLVNRREKERRLCLSGLDQIKKADPKPLTTAEFKADPYSCFGAGRYEAMSEGRQCPTKKWWQK